MALDHLHHLQECRQNEAAWQLGSHADSQADEQVDVYLVHVVGETPICQEQKCLTWCQQMLLCTWR